MIALVGRQEAEEPLGVEYLVRDCRRLDLPPEYDLIAAAYLLNYASSRDELIATAVALSGPAAGS
ncbi:MAG: class I SAM-dependent methyltransferase [Isosphaeraceae bacterium]